jgi:hypothetical protein
MVRAHSDPDFENVSALAFLETREGGYIGLQRVAGARLST